MGITAKGKGVWFVQAIVRVEGKIIKKERTVTGRKSDAEELFLQFKQEMREQNPVPRSGSLKTFDEVIQYFQDRNTHSRAGYIFQRLKKDLGSVRMGELGDRFDRFITMLKLERTRTGKIIMDETVNHYISYAKAVCNFAVKNEKLERNPLSRFSKIKVDNARDRVLSEDEQKKFFSCLEEEAPHLLPAVRFAYQVPIRLGELIRIRKKDIDLSRGVIVLHDGETKNGRGAIIPIPPGMVDYFRSIPEECEYAFYRVVLGTRTVRQSPNPRYVPLGCFGKSWKKVLKKAEIEDFRFHDLRHIACWNLAKNGTPESVIMRIGNWKTPEIFRRYRHISEAEITSAVRFQDDKCIRFVYDCHKMDALSQAG